MCVWLGAALPGCVASRVGRITTAVCTEYEDLSRPRQRLLSRLELISFREAVWTGVSLVGAGISGDKLERVFMASEGDSISKMVNLHCVGCNVCRRLFFG